MTTEATTLTPAAALCCAIDEIAPADDLGQTTAIFKALSDETRLKILKAIAHTSELCECNIVPAFGLSQPTISYHLKVLREAGLVESERRGQWVWHRVNNRAVLGAMRRLAEITE
jgi:ArsR family transcriptional regulator